MKNSTTTPATTTTTLNDLKKLAIKSDAAKQVKGGIIILDWVNE